MNTAPVPELPSIDVWMRGTDAQADWLSNDDEAEIVSNVVRDFYRPLANQMRLIGLRPLAHERSRWADSAIAPDTARAEALARAVGLPNVCREREGMACDGKTMGGTLRFSQAYAVARDSAVIYATYTPARGGDAGEMEFRMARTLGGWQMASRRSLTGYAQQGGARQADADQLLAADRAFGTSAGNTDLVTVLSAMFDDEVYLQIPTGFAAGKPKAIEYLRSNPDNERSRTMWAPIRVGVSADGQHGFSYGYMTLVRPDSVRVALKYLAYWIKRGDTWKVLAYKRRVRPNGDVATHMLAPALPATRLSPTSDPAMLEAHRRSLAAAEKEFSDAAQTLGIGAAFERYGRTHDAMNMGGPTDTAFVIGARAVGRSVGAGYPATGSPVAWASDYRTIVASSGDLGVTFGYIRPHTAPPAGQPQFYPFFTIWKRDPGQPWRYIAE